MSDQPEHVPPAPPPGSAAPNAVAPSLPVPPSVEPNKGMGTGQWGMIAFLLSEVAFFSTLIVTYLNFMGQDKTPPTPRDALSLGLVLVNTICLLSSSATIYFAEGALRRRHASAFALLWGLTILLGAAFLAGTAWEWRDLMVDKHLKISTNLFGTTFYTLVGFHGLHVSIGLIALAVVLLLVLRGAVMAEHALAVELVSWYWHFVDAVWIAVFTVVYLVSVYR